MAVVGITERIFALTVADYHAMIDAGILGGEDKVQLLDGVLIELSPEGPAHAALIARLNRHFAPVITDPGLWVRVQSPLTVAPGSEPEPDLAIVHLGDDPAAHPSTALLVIEVSVSSLQIDRERKARIYASAGVPEYWVVDVAAHAVEIRTGPTADGYRHLDVVGRDAMLTPASVAVEPLALGELFAGLT